MFGNPTLLFGSAHIPKNSASSAHKKTQLQVKLGSILSATWILLANTLRYFREAISFLGEKWESDTQRLQT